MNEYEMLKQAVMEKIAGVDKEASVKGKMMRGLVHLRRAGRKVKGSKAYQGAAEYGRRMWGGDARAAKKKVKDLIGRGQSAKKMGNKKTAKEAGRRVGKAKNVASDEARKTLMARLGTAGVLGGGYAAHKGLQSAYGKK